MTNAIYNLAIEPKETIYEQLIRCSLDYCDHFQFVIRHTIKKNDTCEKLLAKLNSLLISHTEESEWPGTQLMNGTAEIYRYKLSPESISILVSATNSLYSWVLPNFPEDLCFMRASGKPWLVTISHEGDGYLDLSPEEKNNLSKAIPQLILIKDKSYH